MPNHNKRDLCWPYEQQIKAANSIPDQDICASTVRQVLNQMGLLREYRGNQSIGDTLGRHGLRLPSYKENGKAHYTKPAPGASITRAMIEASFNVPPNYAWNGDNSAAFAVAALAVVSATPATTAKPAPVAPTQPVAQHAPTVEVAEHVPISTPAPVAPVPEIADTAPAAEDAEDRPPSAIWLAGQEHMRLNHLSCRLAAAAERAEKRAAESPNDADLAARVREKREEVKNASQPYAPDEIPPLTPIPHLRTPVFPPDNTREDLADDPPIEPVDRLLNSLMNDD